MEGGGSFGTSAGEGGLPVVMERACPARVGERGKEWSQDRQGPMTTLTHNSATGNTPLSRQPRDRPVLLTAIQGLDNFAWLPVGSNSNKTGRGSVSLI